MADDTEARFDVGRNWKAYSEKAITPARLEQARHDLDALLGEIPMTDRSFLDIGFGQGLTLLLAASRGAQVVGCDVNPLCADVLAQNQARYFPELAGRCIPVVVGSILDVPVVENLRGQSAQPDGRAYDVVHAWGVLHHTGDLKRAIAMAASLVRPGGHFIIAIYARHWSSSSWRAIKRLYNRSSPRWQRLWLWSLYPTIYAAKWLVTRRNPLRQSRGMDFYYDVVDWVGGYPYEYASPHEIMQLVEPLGFKLDRIIATTVPTGCNQYVFEARRVSGV